MYTLAFKISNMATLLLLAVATSAITTFSAFDSESSPRKLLAASPPVGGPPDSDIIIFNQGPTAARVDCPSSEEYENCLRNFYQQVRNQQR